MQQNVVVHPATPATCQNCTWMLAANTDAIQCSVHTGHDIFACFWLLLNYDSIVHRLPHMCPGS
jgi:hypothetical protein